LKPENKTSPNNLGVPVLVSSGQLRLGKLHLHSDRPAVSQSAKHRFPLAGTKLHCLATD